MVQVMEATLAMDVPQVAPTTGDKVDGSAGGNPRAFRFRGRHQGELSLAESGSRRTEKLQIMLSDEELTAIDDWRFDSRMPSRAAAIRALISRGLKAEGAINDAGATRKGRAPATGR